MPAFIDLTGQMFGRWAIIAREGSDKHGGPLWRCRCQCGTERLVSGLGLRNGTSRSCGCLMREVSAETIRKTRTTHGHCRGRQRTRTWVIWRAIKDRCGHGRDLYGRHRITMCDRWRESFENFLADMGECPSPEHTIDRWPNQKGNYERNNCRWATMKEQQNNRTNNRLVTHAGKTRTLSQWADIVGIRRSTLDRRLSRYGWTVERALTEPVGKGRRRASWVIALDD